MATSEYEVRPAVLRWHKRAAGQWLLKAEDGTIWVAITAWKVDGQVVQRMWRATFMAVPEQYGLAADFKRRRRWPGWWTTGRQVAALKARVVGDLSRYSHAQFKIQG